MTLRANSFADWDPRHVMMNLRILHQGTYFMLLCVLCAIFLAACKEEPPIAVLSQVEPNGTDVPGIYSVSPSEACPGDTVIVVGVRFPGPPYDASKRILYGNDAAYVLWCRGDSAAFICRPSVSDTTVEVRWSTGQLPPGQAPKLHLIIPQRINWISASEAFVGDTLYAAGTRFPPPPYNTASWLQCGGQRQTILWVRNDTVAFRCNNSLKQDISGPLEWHTYPGIHSSGPTLSIIVLNLLDWNIRFFGPIIRAKGTFTFDSAAGGIRREIPIDSIFTLPPIEGFHEAMQMETAYRWHKVSYGSGGKNLILRHSATAEFATPRLIRTLTLVKGRTERNSSGSWDEQWITYVFRDVAVQFGKGSMTANESFPTSSGTLLSQWFQNYSRSWDVGSRNTRSSWILEMSDVIGFEPGAKFTLEWVR